MKKLLLPTMAAFVANIACAQDIKLPAAAVQQKSLSVVEALATRHSVRAYSSKELSNQELSNLCWAACGVSRNNDFRTSPKLYLYTAIAPIPLSTFAGEPTQNVGRSFLKSYSAVCLEGAIIVLSCIIFSLFASTPPVVDEKAAAVTQVWKYIGELIFNMLVLVGTIKISDRVVREMMGL